MKNPVQEDANTALLNARLMKVRDKVVKNPATWNPSEFDAWGAGEGVGQIVSIVDDVYADVRWPAGKEYRELSQLLPLNTTLQDPPTRQDLYEKHRSKYLIVDAGPRTPIDLFHWEVGAGWLPLIDEFLSSITTEYPDIVQIKEKFGGLRIYGTFNEKDNALLKVYEEKAEQTCETCGLPGNLARTQGHWYYTACPTHLRDNSSVYDPATDTFIHAHKLPE